jgi:hypothetical protein
MLGVPADREGIGVRKRPAPPPPAVPLSADNFGILIGYLIPGFLLVWGLQPSVPVFRDWLSAAADGASVGGFLYGTVAATAAGLFVSALRWAVVDRLYHRTGIPEPRWDFAKLAGQLPAFEGIVANHYRFYQAYSNALVSLVLIYAVSFLSGSRRLAPIGWEDAAALCVAIVLVLASRDALRKYYRRAGDLLADPRHMRRRREPAKA